MEEVVIEEVVNEEVVNEETAKDSITVIRNTFHWSPSWNENVCYRNKQHVMNG